METEFHSCEVNSTNIEYLIHITENTKLHPTLNLFKSTQVHF